LHESGAARIFDDAGMAILDHPIGFNNLFEFIIACFVQMRLNNQALGIFKRQANLQKTALDTTSPANSRNETRKSLPPSYASKVERLVWDSAKLSHCIGNLLFLGSQRQCLIQD